MFEVRFSVGAAKILESVHKTDKKLYSRFVTAIEALAKDPFQGKSLKGELKGDFSLRIGNYRIIYTVHKKELVVYIIDLGHRKDIYR